ncbi:MULTISPECIES: hypothetical protein [Myxococcus]|uniref:Lipoprotein n=1 Tax=Myxococcus landrumensis TaxID=2813577 RepID=A0ABX7N7X4_9BACT|nr:hypothetical protein [Myxococcus landrumus]QSQ14578.1 hypothetical protein JY572_00305 [Myxococcus landrumus]
MRINGVLAGVVAALGLVACGPASVGEEKSEENLGSSEAAICGPGYFYCPTDLAEFWYESLRCPPPIVKPATAQANCEAYCDVTCIDAGWQSP